MRKYVLISWFSVVCFSAGAQFTIEQCWDRARENYPLIERMALIDQAKEYTLSNAAKGYLPQFQLSARASYQSDVTQLPISVPGIEIPVMPKDNYDARLELTQSLWDGGRIAAQKRAAEASARVDRQSLEVDLYTLRERVNQLFFGILVLDGQLEQNSLLEEDLGRTFDQVTAYIAAGIANEADLDAVRVEQINTKQNRLSMVSLREAYTTMLGTMIAAGGNLQLIAPTVTAVDTARIDRPEMWLFDARETDLQTRLDAIKARNRPVINLFAQGGYGQPGLNMLKTGFEPYGLAGVRMSWNFGGQYTKRNDRLLVENARSGVMAQRETFLFNARLELINEQRQADNIRALMREDDRLVELRANIRRSAEAKVAAGTLSVTELMREVIAENLARQNRAIRQIQFLQAVYTLKTTTNN